MTTTPRTDAVTLTKDGGLAINALELRAVSCALERENTQLRETVAQYRALHDISAEHATNASMRLIRCDCAVCNKAREALQEIQP